jgi:AcrR family transcriptional regulator
MIEHLYSLSSVTRRPAPTTAISDHPARERIRDAALRLFGEVGYDGTSVRAVAEVASVSAGLVIHHFGSKEGLRTAVDEAVVARFRSSVDDAVLDTTGEGNHARASASWGRALGSVILADPDLRAYLRRSLLDGSGPGSAVIDHLLTETERGIDTLARAGALRGDVDREWLPYQILFVVLGPLLFENFMQRRIATPMFEPAMVDRRSAASHDLISRGLRADS